MRHNLQIVIYGAYLLTVSLVLTELALSFFFPSPLFESVRVTTGDNMKYKLVENAELIYVPVPNSGPLNSIGHRGALVSPKPPHARERILFVGDSVVEGLGVETDQRFTALVSKKLRQNRKPRSEYQIVNFGVRGYNLYQYYEYLKHEMSQYEFDHLVVGVTYNDLMLHSGEITRLKDKLEKVNKNDFYAAYYGVRDSMYDGLLNFHVGRYLLYFLSRRDEPPSSDENLYGKARLRFKKNRSEVEKTVKQLERLATSKNATLSFVLFPINPNHPYHGQMNSIRQALQENNVRYLDLEILARQAEDGQSRVRWFLNENDPCHFSVLGNNIVAEYILENLPFLVHSSDRWPIDQPPAGTYVTVQ